MGHGALRFFHCKYPERVIIIPAKIKIHVLCALKKTNQVIFETRPARAAPAPSVTKSAGKAQQTSVEVEAKRERAASIPSFFISVSFYFYDAVTRVRDALGNIVIGKQCVFFKVDGDDLRR